MTSEDRLPPADYDAEFAVIGCCLGDAAAIPIARGLLSSEDFYSEPHRRIFAAIEKLADDGKQVHEVSVAGLLKDVDPEAVEGNALDYLRQARQDWGTVPDLGSQYVKQHAERVKQKAVLWRLIQTAGKIQAEAYANPEDVGGFLAEAQALIRDLAEGQVAGKAASLLINTAREVAGRLQDAMHDEPYTTLARSGIDTFDKKTGGLGIHRLVIPRAPTKGLKSVFAQQCALATALQFRDSKDARKQGRIVVCYILEALEVWQQRAWAWLGDFPGAVFEPWSSGTVDEKTFDETATQYMSLGIYATDQLRDIASIENDLRAKTLQENTSIGLVVIDHLQRLSGGRGDNITARAEEVAVRIATLADELRCPFVCPSQQTEKEGGERISKWSRAWDENATLVFDIERGDRGDSRDQWQESEHGRFVLHACRYAPPFGVLPFHVDLPTCHIYGVPEQDDDKETDPYEKDARW